jgi:hypothetical protein
LFQACDLITLHKVGDDDYDDDDDDDDDDDSNNNNNNRRRSYFLGTLQAKWVSRKQ